LVFELKDSAELTIDVFLCSHNGHFGLPMYSSIVQAAHFERSFALFPLIQ